MNIRTLLPIIVSILALAFLDPFMLFMTEGIQAITLGGLLLATASYGFFVLTEQASDEREVSNRAQADRYSSLVGMGLLVIVIAYQLLVRGQVCQEIIIILVAMVLTKSAAHYYASNHR